MVNGWWCWSRLLTGVEDWREHLDDDGWVLPCFEYML